MNYIEQLLLSVGMVKIFIFLFCEYFFSLPSGYCKHSFLKNVFIRMFLGEIITDFFFVTVAGFLFDESGSRTEEEFAFNFDLKSPRAGCSSQEAGVTGDSFSFPFNLGKF